MAIKPMLGDWEVPKISAMRTLEKRAMNGVNIPGLPGGVFQKLDAKPTRIYIAGSIFSDEQRDEFLDAIREKYNEGDPLTFVSDILTGTDVQYVVIEELKIDINAVRPDQIDYALILSESPPPPPPTSIFGDIDTGLLDQAGDFMDSVTGALGALDALGNLPDIGDPTAPLTSALDEVEETMSTLGGMSQTINGLFG